ncbi:ATP-binding protein [Methyloligella sp. 2.7D]|uniref:hybrid sensor histidine kinase/response regulator n=1 Tax=unclassified Methyloligella TaxID=2625955 RepID=UPI00157D37F0|nr:ATP-binding protein [Methyloligella sp. GL2]QKP76626.1 response regulator [Methyloligella sp. GL2]
MADAPAQAAEGESELDAVWEGLDVLDTGILIWSSDRKLVYINEGFHRSCALPVSLGMRYEDYVAAVAHSQEWVVPGDPEQWAHDKIGDFGTLSDSDFQFATGNTMHVAQRPTRADGMAVTFTDVTAVKRNERELREAKEAAEATDEAKSRFLRAANHDLRQPLASLKILIYNCLQEQDEEQRREILHAMGVSASIMEDLLGALLQIGQLDAGRIQPRITSFQLSELFERIQIQFDHQAQEKGIDLRFVTPHKTVSTDRALLERILSNFVANAIRFTEVGGVLVGCRKEGRGLRIEVVDTGRGISEEDCTRVFDEFYRVTDDSRKQRKGLGLGLNIVKRLADLLEHPIGVRSRPDKGSIFSVWVPLGNIWHSDIGPAADVSEAVGGEFAGTPVLLIEDDEILRESMAQLLRRWGIDVHPAPNKDEAIRLVSEGLVTPELIIADYNLQTRTGLEAIEAVRDLVDDPEMPAMVVTADAEPKVISNIQKAGIPVLVKPVSPPRLRVLMHNLLFEPDFLKQTMGP